MYRSYTFSNAIQGKAVMCLDLCKYDIEAGKPFLHYVLSFNPFIHSFRFDRRIFLMFRFYFILGPQPADRLVPCRAGEEPAAAEQLCRDRAEKD